MERITRRRILIHSIVFSPDSVSTAYLYNDIALGFKDDGYQVVVLTTTPHYNIIEKNLLKQPLRKKLFGLFFISDFNGIYVIHIPCRKHKSTLLRIFSFIYWHFFSFLISLTIKKLDFILSPSPPLTIGFVSILIAKIKKAKFIYNVQEIYPDLLIKNGTIKSNILIKLFKWLESYIYNNATAVITIDQKFYDQIVGRFNNKDKLKIIPNFVDTDLYKPLTESIIFKKPFIKNPEKIILLYAGNIGFYQDWEIILYAANKLSDTNIEFWIVGEGVKRLYLLEEIKKQNIRNIKVLPYQNRELMPMINSFADIHFISISKNMEQEGFPSKVYTIMASAKPMIIVTGKETPLYNLLKDLNCSILITENKYEKFINAIIELSIDKKKQIELGINGFNEIQKNYTKKIIIKKYIEFLHELQ